MKKLVILSTFLLLSIFAFGQSVTISPNGSGTSIIDVSSTSKGFLPPRMTTAQRGGIQNPAIGLLVYDTDENEMYINTGTWKKVIGVNAPLTLSSNFATPITGINSLGGSNNSGVEGKTTSNTGGTGVYGWSEHTNPTGGGNWGVYGENKSTNALGWGIYGKHYGTGVAIEGEASNGGTAVKGVATTGNAIYGSNNSATNATGRFTNAGTADAGRFENTGGGAALSAEGNAGPTAYLHNNSDTQRALFVVNDGTFEASRFENTAIGGLAAIGVKGIANSGVAISGTSGTGIALDGANTSATYATGRLINYLAGGNALEIDGALMVSGNKTAFKIISDATLPNIVGNQLKIPNTTLANNANDILIITHNNGSFGTNLNKAFGVIWSGTNWNIYLEDGTAMPDKITFNILVIKQ